MTQAEIKEKYRQLFTDYSNELEQVTARIKQIGMIRLFFFLAWIIAIFFCTRFSWAVLGPVLGGGIIIFGLLVRIHGKLHKRKNVLEQLIMINLQEENSMEWNFSDHDDGSEYLNGNHLFSHDLDLFGKGSLFQYINRSSTKRGKNKLAAELSGISKSKNLIIEKQEAIAELASLFGWRQDFRVRGMMVEEQAGDIPGLTDWVSLKPDFKGIFFRILLIVVPLINLAMFILLVMNVISFWHFMAYLVIPLALSGIKHRTVNKKHNLLSGKFPVLKKYSSLFDMIESQSFSSRKLQNSRQTLISNGLSAGRAVKQLARITNAFDTRLNLLAGFLMNIFFLWDIRQSVRLEKWKEKYKSYLPGWFEVIGEVDALVSFAGYAYNNPDFIFPDIVEGDEMYLKAEQLGHPLIHAGKRVCNDYRVNGWGQFTILTGANMAGKSTFLRTVGVNIILAGCGAPVCAVNMQVSPVDMVTSIHTIDSLANNESYFYAELKRLKMIIDMLKKGNRVFIILDEILKGTNSRDKQSGSKALVEQLISLKAAGIIATHDLSLGELEKRFPDHIKNQCFEVIIDKDRLDYDYILKEGIAQNMNATILMERMGITVS
ncbi:MAG: hypothetical protein RQ761_07675 [Bacteroidales bacterium]|nr:hypothetical protein [Bacteroidales bacterium]